MCKVEGKDKTKSKSSRQSLLFEEGGQVGTPNTSLRDKRMEFSWLWRARVTWGMQVPDLSAPMHTLFGRKPLQLINFQLLWGWRSLEIIWKRFLISGLAVEHTDTSWFSYLYKSKLDLNKKSILKSQKHVSHESLNQINVIFRLLFGHEYLCCLSWITMKGTHTVFCSYQVYYSNFKLRMRLIIKAACVQRITELKISQKILFYSYNNPWSMEGVIPILQKSSLTETELLFVVTQTGTG